MFSLIVLVIIAFGCFGLGSYFGTRHAVASGARLDNLAAELANLKRHTAREATGTSGRTADAEDRAALVADIKKQLQAEMGLTPIDLLKARRESFVELYSYDNRGSSSYGTAGYLGDGYFITVKHGVVSLDPPDSIEGRGRRVIETIKLMHRGRPLKAKLIDAGDAHSEVDPGDWAILKVKEPVDLPPLSIDLDYGYEFAEPIFRLGNDYSKGIILATGYVGQRTPNNLVTCLTDGHPGVSGGGVIDRRGHLVGIPVGRMQGDYRFSFILPLRDEMFRRVPHLQRVGAVSE
ncbi:MAG: trypsin-like peptidase domain-containing protein [Vicinamibacterales bacterium]